MAVVGLGFCYGAVKRGGVDLGTALATLLAALPTIWFAVRVILTR